MNPSSIIRIHPADNVAIAVAALRTGERSLIGDRSIVVAEDIPAGHKISLTSIPAGSAVYRYGFPIGTAVRDIEPGVHVHTQNLVTALDGADELVYRTPSFRTESTAGAEAVFQGYRRENGSVGVRNEVWILSSVGCVNRSAERIARLAADRTAGRADGVHAFTHPFGCSQLGDDLGHTRRILAGLARNPNAGGVLVLGLGCENNRLESILREAGSLDRSRIRYFNAQEVSDEIETGLDALDEILNATASDRREPCSAADLVIGLKCGGSDGLSGITANSVVGAAVDRLCGLGAAAVLTEVPEMFGAEQVLMNRAVSSSVFDRAAAMINRFKAYYTSYGLPIHENPSPGNRDGGLTTLEEKSLGAIQKGGRAPVVQVLDYGSPMENGSGRSGLTIVEAPGNDGVSTTALAAAGASLILFTTGRGTPLGGPVPTIKVSSNSDLALRKPQWIDFDCGRLIDGEVSREALADELVELICSVASGRLTKNEASDNREIAIWKEGVTL